MKTNILKYILIALIALTYSNARADVAIPAISSIDFINPSSGNYSLGWSFTLNEGVTVTSLGFFNYNAYEAPGGLLNESHLVGIFDAQGVLLASTTVQITDPQRGLLNWSTLTDPLALFQHQTYYIESVTTTDPFTYSSVITTASWLNFGTNNYSSASPTSTLQFPDSTSGTKFDAAYIGPNFEGIPTPTTLALISAGLIGFGVTWRRTSHS